jgi:hypothetical protein
MNGCYRESCRSFSISQLPVTTYSVEKLEKLTRPDFRLIQFSPKKLLKTYPGGDEMICAESLDILYIPRYQNGQNSSQSRRILDDHQIKSFSTE